MEYSHRLIALATQLRAETHPHLKNAVGVDSRLERDLGFDSLARAELLMRIEREFGIALSGEVLGAAETLRELLDAVAAAQGHGVGVPLRDAAPEPMDPDGVAVPVAALTLLDVLDAHAAARPQRTHIVHVGVDGEQGITYGELRERSLAVAAGLQARGFRPGAAAAIMLPTCPEFFPVFLGILLAGGIPVPIYPPARPSQIEDHLRRHAAILANAGATVLITVPAAVLPARLLRGQVEGLRDVLIAADLVGTETAAVRVAAKAEDIAFLQYTSGSTGTPKGVALTHANLLANVRAMGAAVAATADDVFVSWLPLYHDMGLICAWLSSLYFGVRFVVMSPLDFLARPACWLEAITRHRGTLSGAPNFAYELCVKRIPEEELARFDLSSWRVAFNGAEPVNADTMMRFAERFAACGLRPEALAPAYGLAECAVGLAVTPQRGLRVDAVRRVAFATRGEAEPAATDEVEVLRFVACGRPLPGHEIRIVDAAGRELPERREGRLQFRGPSTTAGYFRNPEATRALMAGDGWLDSGDTAYLADGEVFPTGRAKDLIIKGGRNLYPQELEAAVGEIPGIRKGNVAVFGCADAATGTERLIVAAETRETDPGAQAKLAEAIRACTLEVLGVPADDVVVSHRHIVLKTSSGKIRRAGSRELYERGGAATDRAVWLQVARLALAGLWPTLRRRFFDACDFAWAVWAWAVFAALVGPTWLAVVLLPLRSWRWTAARLAARTMLVATGVRWSLRGGEHLAVQGPFVLVANHASYLDGLILAAALPWREWRFVAKRELADNFFAGRFLTALGADFVERFDFRQGVADAGRIAASIQAGHAPVFFAEGTFTRVPGLMPFRMGAFVAAASNGVPVLPLALAGTRDLLRDGTWMPRRHPVTVTLSEAIPPEGNDWAAAVRLRDVSRRVIASHCGESDLGASP